MSMYCFLERIVMDAMTRDVVTVSRHMPLRDLEALFEAHDFNAFPVVEAGRMVGIVTKFDFLKAFAFTTHQIIPHYEDLMRTTVGEVMTEAIIDVQPDARLTRVLQLMVNLRGRSLPVRNSAGDLVGMISREDIIRALKKFSSDSELIDGLATWAEALLIDVKAAWPHHRIVKRTSVGQRPEEFDYASQNESRRVYRARPHRPGGQADPGCWSSGRAYPHHNHNHLRD